MKLHTIIEEYNNKYTDIVLMLLNNIKDLNYEKRTFISNSLQCKACFLMQKLLIKIYLHGMLVR